MISAFGNTAIPDFLRLAGLPVNQPDLPWWVEGVLDWLLRCKAIQEGWGNAGDAARYKLDVALGDQPLRGYARGPEAVYSIYADMLEMQEAERNNR